MKPSAITPAMWPASIVLFRHGGQGEAVEKAGLDVTREISARVHRREQRALDERDGYGEGEERVGREARQHRRGLEAGRVHGDEQGREDERGDERGRLPGPSERRSGARCCRRGESSLDQAFELLGVCTFERPPRLSEEDVVEARRMEL